MIGAAFAAACCLGISAVLATAGALGLGFLIKDAYLMPIFVAFISASLWLLYRSAARHGDLLPFWAALTGSVTGTAALWLLLTGLHAMPWLVYVGLAALFGGSLWNFANAMRSRKPARAHPVETSTVESGDSSAGAPMRIISGAAISIAAAAAFLALYKSVDVLAPQAAAGEMACWGINACKGQTACTTALNACTGQNDCKGRGFLNVSEKDCYLRGGVPLAGSEGDPATG